MNLTKSFSKSEFMCSCGCEECNMKPSFMAIMQNLRDACGFPLNITSGYRCVEHNKRVGGVPRSRHVVGDAADISLRGLDKEQRDKLKRLIEGFADIHGRGYGTFFIHIDTRPGKDISWTYP